ncbi:hypothetical protein V5O48_011905 [Marasmius crinis-equi]|uniref:F-box domain-containing protein n=1 Tax=Marasmius crinis-equi TaxID=585013 RepID=A0ABR3F4A5_9AGAR
MPRKKGRQSHTRTASSTPNEQKDGCVVAPNLPVEIVSLIVENVEDRTTVESISLLSSNWRAVAQERMFERIFVSNAEQCKAWSRKFTKYPHLGLYVKDLHLFYPHDNGMDRSYLRGRAAKTLVSSLPNVRNLEVADMIRWGPVELRLMKSLGRSVRNLSVDELVGMDRSRGLPELLCAFPNVEALSLGSVGRDAQEEGHPVSLHEAGLAMRRVAPEDGRPRELHELTLLEADCATETLLWLTGPAFDLSKLRTLSLSWSTDSNSGWHKDVIDEFIRDVGKYVTKLTLGLPLGNRSDWQETTASPQRTFDPNDVFAEHFMNTTILQQFTALEAVAFTFGAMDNYEYESSFRSPLYMSHVPFLLQRFLPTASCLKSVKIAVTFNEESLSIYSWVPSWRVFDEFLCGDEAFRPLKYVEFDVDVKPHRIGGDIPLPEEVVTTVSRCLPKTVAKNSRLVHIAMNI